ncbi:sugar phosphate isomerase/epimerase family protein [Flagellimonas nanhaiensis]|uniref:Sugar phosphate isomerase/epimerase n=1 Tax=Flagellimonas nanhaiensis TaxID=2292706 RepID=A0A371JS06_9FLAO|nr:TIM barrel protein [Allomuricauda nanhaiensis]RDY60300.1 sugar phosphate isomerase/epimerase [Allomuricauda nanhaiensis]
MIKKTEQHKNPGVHRREFLKKSTLAGSALIIAPLTIANEGIYSTQPTKYELDVFIFSKHLQFLNYQDMCEAAAEMGFDGLDLTVRPKGHVLPERVSEDLPRAVEAMRAMSFSPTLMTTNITNADKTVNIEVLKAASTNGFTHYRTGWLDYPENRSIPESIEVYAEQFRKLESVNKELSLIGCYQNHSGNHVGAPIWDLPHLLSKTNNTHLGCQYDIRHAVVEGGRSWELGLRNIASHIKTIAIKDFKWGIVNGKRKPINTPLGKGMVDFKRYFSLLRKYGVQVPVSLHFEYGLGGAEHGNSEITIEPKKVFEQMKNDLSFLRNTWKEVQ